MSDEHQRGPKLPNLGGPSSGPKLAPSSPDEPEVTDDTVIEEVQTSSPPETKKTSSVVNQHEIIRRWGVNRRRLRDALQTMMLREMKEVVPMTKVNEVFRLNIAELMTGHLNYFNEMVEMINNSNDELSIELQKKEGKNASTIVFETLIDIIQQEIDEMNQDGPVIVDYIDLDLKRFRDARVEPRASWWVLWYAALQMREIRKRSEEQLDIVLRVMLQYKPVMRRVLGVFVNFIDQLIRTFEPFPIDFARVRLTRNSTNTGYNLAPWIKPRYGTYSQTYMEYERFLKYYSRSFGTVPGNAPKIENGPLQGYRAWMQRALEGLETQLRTSTLITTHARGDTLEGMLKGLQMQLENVLKERQYDEDGKLTNQPVGGEGAVKFLEWLFETALNRYTTTNIAIHKDSRLSLEMFEFIPDTVRWVNEYGEQIVMDWLIPLDE